MAVEVNNLTAVSVREGILREAAELVLRKEGGLRNDLSIALVGQTRMRRLNKIYRGKNKSTDVLSFLSDKAQQKQFYGQTRNMGEVIISLPDVKKNAVRFNVASEDELLNALVHGILHLLGYNHEKTKKEAKIMFAKEKRYFRAINKITF